MLAARYKLSGEHPAEVALENAEVARSLGRHDLCHMWTLASLILEDTLRADESKSPRRLRWGLHPLGRQLVQNLLDYLARLGDIQTLAMFCCIFAEPFPPMPSMHLLEQPVLTTLPLGASAGMEHDHGHGHPGVGSGHRDYFTMPTSKSRPPLPLAPAAPAPAPAPTPAVPVETSKLSALAYWPGFGLRLSQVPTRDTDVTQASDASQGGDPAITTTTRSPHAHNHHNSSSNHGGGNAATSISGFAPSNGHGPLVMPTTVNTTGMAQSYTSDHAAIISPSLMAALASAIPPAQAAESWLTTSGVATQRSGSGFKVVMLYNERDFDSETR
ncbi:hypothetical protein SYNPS1DRAFT_22387 [Syncephalis pseudoplumigaleata]|uniref:Uncharacterized protein n=1 Tax=Syncephalis pseudoplumigaleata TaxID=1712513 RepID=A0A4P9YZX2_9FUNG|nr:hypothetical protein SYNPS1DRAFT_22387 [Syncephalis pseudoplumigaleata]|eukprot:RKP25696.1 hypothetical protein SYNPS1DRAFT_22387 [Syncephalis pseudoplumigaleata]